MKKFKLNWAFSMMMAAFSVAALTSCDDSSSGAGTNGNILSGEIKSDKTLTADKKWTLKGNVFVTNGATLTIEAGTIIFGDKVTKGSLIIERGAKISAIGTESDPIVFTSAGSPGFRNYGDWGGIILLGKAQNNQNANQPIEGITGGPNATDPGHYGGTADDDNSGVMKYVRIEFAGIALSTDNEINGLTFGSVGSGTTIEHIQVSYSGDDSYEWFGGTVNAQYLVAYRGYDDDFDTDFGFRGNVQYAVSFRDPNRADKSGSNGFESDNDGNGSTNTPKTACKFSNVTWFGPQASAALSTGNLKAGNADANYQFGGHLRRNSDIQIYNSIFVGSQLQGVHFDKTGSAAVFKGNYFARCGVNVSKEVKKTTVGNSYDDSAFATDNILEADQGTVDISAKISSIATVLDLSNPSGLLNASSSLLTGAATVPTGLTQETYIGAFNSTSNWMSGWTNFDPVNTNY